MQFCTVCIALTSDRDLEGDEEHGHAPGQPADGEAERHDGRQRQALALGLGQQGGTTLARLGEGQVHDRDLGGRAVGPGYDASIAFLHAYNKSTNGMEGIWATRGRTSTQDL